MRAELPYDCAGSAKIEALGIVLVRRLEGTDPTALIGLPLIALVDLLAEFGVSPLAPRVNAGVLYLAPVLLGNADPAEAIPSGVQAVLRELRYFIAEEPKGARAFLKSIGHPGPLAELAIAKLAADPTPATLEALLAPVRAGASAAVLSEAGAPGVLNKTDFRSRALKAPSTRAIICSRFSSKPTAKWMLTPVRPC